MAYARSFAKGSDIEHGMAADGLPNWPRYARAAAGAKGPAGLVFGDGLSSALVGSLAAVPSAADELAALRKSLPTESRRIIQSALPAFMKNLWNDPYGFKPARNVGLLARFGRWYGNWALRMLAGFGLRPME
jgi:hypothetical protein